MNEVDIASFAESMLTEQLQTGKPVQFAAAQSPDAPDVSEVEVTDDFTHQILTEGLWAKANIKVDPPSQPIKRKKSPPISERVHISKAPLSEEMQIRKDLFEEYRQKLGELDKIVQEMTTVGVIGVGAGAVVAPGMSVSSKRKKKKKSNARTNRFN